MKIMTKEWIKNIDFHDLIITLEPNTNKKIPFIFMNGGTECVAKEDLHTVKTHLNLTEKENEINFIMLPDTFDFVTDYSENDNTINEKAYRNEFLLQYLNRLRVISYIPEKILKRVKDKRLLALGYADKETKKDILNYIKRKYIKAYNIYDECNAASVKAEEGLTIHKQIKKYAYIHSVPFIFDQARITKAEKVNDDICLTLENFAKAVFSGAKILEEEVNISRSCVRAIELYKKTSSYELHFLIMKTDKNFIDHYYNVTYTFKDLKLKLNKKIADWLKPSAIQF